MAWLIQSKGDKHLLMKTQLRLRRTLEKPKTVKRKTTIRSPLENSRSPLSQTDKVTIIYAVCASTQNEDSGILAGG